MNFNQLGNSTGNSRYCRIIVDLCPGSQPSAACGRQPCNCWSCTGPWWGPGASWQRAAGGFMESRCSVSCFIHPRTIKTKGLYIHTIYIYIRIYSLFVCLFVRLFVCLLVCLFVGLYLGVRLKIGTHMWVQRGNYKPEPMDNKSNDGPKRSATSSGL